MHNTGCEGRGRAPETRTTTLNNEAHCKRLLGQPTPQLHELIDDVVRRGLSSKRGRFV